MANNVLEHLAQMSTPDVKRANWNWDFTNVGTNDFGFWKVKFCKLINANTNVKLDFKSAYSTNPTISPVFSKAKVRVTAFWVPISLYVPALRDNVAVKPGQTDFVFPNVSMPLELINSRFTGAKSLLDNFFINHTTAMDLPGGPASLQAWTDILTAYSGVTLHYIPEGSLMAELGMYKPNFEPVTFCQGNTYDENFTRRNAIPLLGYLDFYRTYIANSQDDMIPIRLRSFKPSVSLASYSNEDIDFNNVIVPEVLAKDELISRSSFDTFFNEVRRLGLNFNGYPTDPANFDITTLIDDYLVPPFSYKSAINASLYGAVGNTITIENLLKVMPPICIPDNHYFELRDTYSADYFTAFLSNENVEYERSTARVVASDGGVITMEQIYAAERVQNYIRRSVFKNQGYADFVESQTGVTPPTNLSHPMFLGSVSTDLFWNDVVSQTQSGDNNDLESNTSLGSRASIGFGRMVTGSYKGGDGRPFVNFTAREPGYLMLCESIVPDVSYFMTYDCDYDKLSLEDLYWPAFDKDGYQDKHFAVICQSPDSDFSKLPMSQAYPLYNVAYAQEPAYFEYMAQYNKMTGQMVEPGVYRHWVFSRQGYVNLDLGDQFMSLHEYRRRMTSVYVDPEPYNKIFANENGLDNFQTYYDFDVKVYQPLSHRFLSF